MRKRTKPGKTTTIISSIPVQDKPTTAFLYLSAQSTLYKRGSASIAEMQARTICEALSYRMEYGKAFSTDTKRPLADLDALTSITVEDFMLDFLSKCELTPLPP